MSGLGGASIFAAQGGGRSATRIPRRNRTEGRRTRWPQSPEGDQYDAATIGSLNNQVWRCRSDALSALAAVSA